ncbi:hypothetical protein CVT26_004134 [Gymnopilus dilepis]|uniref:Integrase catalytic domain-containing protein n=1 Tax=Gymnopilus dilepis TaxID=231916 RepID=A0A409YV90_9AGAR|nr:hypothetical protein CVT26_004134 [Gymnopilus dilepis]
MGKRKNQYLPNPPIEEIEPIIRELFQMQLNDKQILDRLLEEHIDRSKYGLGLTKFRAIKKEIGLLGTRSQKHTLESINQPIKDLRKRFPKAGVQDMKMNLFHERGMCVSRSLISTHFLVCEPKLLEERKAHRLKRKIFFAAGVFDMVCVDQHDKWLYLGLGLHTGVDPFVGRLLWINVWWTNKNPRLICSYYLDSVEGNDNFMPLVTQSDLGTENFGIANAQTVLRQWNDPRLEGSIQHRWMREKKNKGVTEGWYDTTRPLDVLTFCWLFIPWLQTELDRWMYRVNNTRKRADRNKILPHGIPNDINKYPHRYGCLDFKVPDPEALKFVREEFATSTDPVFELVPTVFGHYATEVYGDMGRPALNSDNIWSVYRDLLGRLEELHSNMVSKEYVEVVDSFCVDQPDEPAKVDLMEGSNLLGGMENPNPDGSYYMGGLNGGQGLGMCTGSQC